MAHTLPHAPGVLPPPTQWVPHDTQISLYFYVGAPPTCAGVPFGSQAPTRNRGSPLHLHNCFHVTHASTCIIGSNMLSHSTPSLWSLPFTLHSVWLTDTHSHLWLQLILTTDCTSTLLSAPSGQATFSFVHTLRMAGLRHCPSFRGRTTQARNRCHQSMCIPP